MNKSTLFVFVVAVAISLIGCGGAVNIDSSGEPDFGASGSAGSAGATPDQDGQAGTGGSSSTGGNAGEAGAPGTGGSAGVDSDAGTAGSAGSSGTGGSAGSGGSSDTGGSSGSGGSAGAAGAGGSGGCTPTVTFTTLTRASDTVMPGSKGYAVMTANIAVDSCSDVSVDTLALFMASPDFANTDPAAYCKVPCAAPSDWNFRNLRVASLDNGSTIAGPLANPKQSTSNQLARMEFTDAFTIRAGQAINVALVMDVPAPLAADVIGKRFRGLFAGINTTPPSVLDANDASQDPNANFTVVAPQELLTIELDAASPVPGIVIAGKASWVPFGQYNITNPTALAQTFSIANLRQMDANGDNADFTAVALAMNGAVVMDSVAVDSDGNWGAMGGPNTSSITVQPGSSIKVQTWGMMANVVTSSAANGQWHGVARSGHTPSLALDSVLITLPNALYTQSANTSLPYPMVLRKSKPTVTSLPLMANVLVNVDLDLYKLHVVPDSAGSVALKQVVFQFEKTPNVSLSNFRMRRGSFDMDINSYTITDALNANSLRTGSIPAGTDTGSIVFAMAPGMEETLAGSGNVYTIHATVSGASSGQSVSFGIAREASSDALTGLVTDSLRNGAMGMTPDSASVYHVGAFYGTFIWSDMSEVPHDQRLGADGGSNDWTNDQYLQDLTQQSFLRVQ